VCVCGVCGVFVSVWCVCVWCVCVVCLGLGLSTWTTLLPLEGFLLN